MTGIRTLFISKLYHARFGQAEALLGALEQACGFISAEDEAGKAWSREKGYQGFTSYASLNDLPLRDPAFAALKKQLDKHAGAFAKALHLNLCGRKLTLDSMWVNVLAPGGSHSGHIHPHAVLSGTFYVAVPEGASSLKLEDPRLPLMMSAPPRAEDAPEEERAFVYIAPQAGDVVMWESYLRHEVPPNRAKKPRVSVSFNYAW